MRCGLAVTFALQLACASLAVAEESISFLTPKETKMEKAEECGKALANRCKAYGFAGVSALVVEKDGDLIIELHAAGWTDGMRTVATIFALVPCKKLELYGTRAMEKAEIVQFNPGKKDTIEKVLASPAPDGTAWAPVLKDPVKDSDSADAPPEEALKSLKKELLVKAKVVRAPSTKNRWSSEPSQAKTGPFGIHMTEADGRKLGLDPACSDRQEFTVYWVADGQFVIAENQLQKVDKADPPALFVFMQADINWLDAFTKNPLPFALTPVPKVDSKAK